MLDGSEIGNEVGLDRKKLREEGVDEKDCEERRRDRTAPRQNGL